MRLACARALSPRELELELIKSHTAQKPMLRAAQLFAAGAKLAAHTKPALRTGLMAPASLLLHVSRGVVLDFDLLFLLLKLVVVRRGP